MRATKIKVGDVFNTSQGACEVILYKHSREVVVKFQDEHGYVGTFEAGHLRNGKVNNPFHPSVFGVGYSGIGKHKHSKNGVMTIEHVAWRSMIARCYSHKIKEIFPTYKDVTVCKDWHNFQVFAEWYTNQEFYGKGYQLDKDILSGGSGNLYSPETCVLVPDQINKLIMTRAFYKDCSLPRFITYSKKKETYSAIVTKFGKAVRYNNFKTLNEAVAKYNDEKLDYIRKVADIWYGLIDRKVYEALINWRLGNNY